jgi:flavin reductase (NADH)
VNEMYRTGHAAAAWQGRAVAEAVGPESAVDIRPLMACFPTGVAVVTAFSEDATPCGMTCSALCSVTLDPPTLLICLRRGSFTLDAVLFGRAFAVNFLTSQARPTAELFASAGGRRFDRVQWSRADGSCAGPHLVEDAHVVADCSVADSRPVGTHDVVFGLVTRVTWLQTPQPLLYGMRRYTSWPAFGLRREPTNEEASMSLAIGKNGRADQAARELGSGPAAAGARADRDGSAEVDELFGRFRAAAAKLLNEHVNATGRCVHCHRVWPCETACQAETVLAAF